MIRRAALCLAAFSTVPLAHADPTPAPPLGNYIAVKDVAASSTFADKKDRYAAWQTVSFDFEMAGDLMVPSTAWCEGKKDEGIGEGITVNFAKPTKLDTLQIAAGVWKTPKLFSGNNRITKLAISFDGGEPTNVIPSAKREWLAVKVGKEVSSIAIKIAAVKKGKANDSCISGLDFLVGDDSINVLHGIDAAAATALPNAYKAMFAALTDEKRSGLEGVLAFPFSYSPPKAFFEPKLTKQFTHKSWATLEIACRKKSLGCPGEPNIRAEEPVPVVGEGPGKLELTFPSTREIVERWHLAWVKDAWKLTSIDYTTP